MPQSRRSHSSADHTPTSRSDGGVPDSLGDLELPSPDVPSAEPPQVMPPSPADGVVDDASALPLPAIPDLVAPWSEEAPRPGARSEQRSSRGSWDDTAAETDRFTFPPPAAPLSSVAPVAMAPEEDEGEIAPQTGLRWATLLVALTATLGTTALVLGLYGIATQGGNALWGWSWQSAPRASAASFAAGETAGPVVGLDTESMPGGLPPRTADLEHEARQVIDKVAATAAVACRTPGSGPVAVKTTVSFDPAGLVRDVTLAPATGGHTTATRCLDDLLHDARMSPFDGAAVTVTRTVVIP